MKTKLILVFLCLFLTYDLSAQLDFTHWLPPMHSRDDAQITDHYLYLSTPNPTPFTVTITDGSGTVLASPVISAGAPFTYTIAPDDPSIIMVDDVDLNSVLTNKGIIASAPEKFYCNFRARSNLQATSITCKGNAARGEMFRIGAMPQQFEHGMRNFTVGFMATEDNTVIDITDYDAGVEFFDVTGNILDDALNFVLDSGECYVLSGYNNIIANLDGFIGALVTANKPIVLNNGNWCGSICDAGGQDIGMDQSVPVEIIGDEYILIRGDGDVQMERPLVVAHTNATDIYVNSIPEPIATINAGEYFLIPEFYYTGAGHENMFIHTSAPAYVYQPLGGSPSRATPGLNFIPPISCAMTKEIDMIPSIDQIGGTNYNGAIICFTLAGATVSVNGIPQVGAEPVDGAPEWETYKIAGFTGDVVITSTDRMAAGMFGFSGDAGFAGFYSGFDQLGFVDFSFVENCETLPVEFTDETVTYAEEIIAWDWDFGDGTSSFLVNPVHIYPEGGTYDVFLEVTTNLGCTDTITYPVEVRPAPVAHFELTNVCDGETITVADSSEFEAGAIVDWTWDMGDLTASTDSSFDYTYAGYGDYLVSLSVTGDNGCVDDYTDSVHIFPVPTPDFTSLNDCYYDSSHFTNTSFIAAGEITEYIWEFGDDSGPSAAENPSHLYDTYGEYDVTLSVLSDEGCLSETTLAITRFAAPDANFSTEDICIYETLLTENSSSIPAPYIITTYTWEMGDGTTSALDAPTYDYGSYGIYDIMLIAHSAEGCVDTAFQTVQVYDQPAVLFSVDDACVYDAATFENLSTLTDGEISVYTWDFGDGTASAEESPEHTYASHGIYEIELTAFSEHGCSNDTTLTVERFAAPEVGLASENACLYELFNFENTSGIAAPYEIASYSWNFGDGIVSDLDTPSHNYMEAGEYTVSLTATSANGCIGTGYLNLFAYAVPELEFTAEAVCQNEGPTVFENTSTIDIGYIATWIWEFEDEMTSGLENPTYNFASSGAYEVELIGVSEHGCADTITNNALVRALPFAEFEIDNPVICGNECVELNSMAFSPTATITSLEWSTTYGHEGYGETVEFCFENYDFETNYFDVQLIASDNFGCSDTLIAEDLIKTLPTPKAAFTTNPDEVDLLNPVVDFVNLSLYASHYEWDFGDGSALSTEVSPTHEYMAEPEGYNVILYAFNNTEKECVDTAMKTIKILDHVIYFVPNAFTPDGDQYNNIFQPVFTAGFDPYDFHLSIYNRWGEVMFESYNASVGWNGTYNDMELVQDGVYVWKIEFKERMTGKVIEDYGHVTLLK